MAENEKPQQPTPSSSGTKFTEKDYELLQKLNRELIAMGKRTQEFTASYERFMDGLTDEAAFNQLQSLQDAIEKSNENIKDSITSLKNIQLEYVLLSKKGKEAMKDINYDAEIRKQTIKEVAKSIGTLSSNYQRLVEDVKGIETLGEKDLENIIVKSQKEKERISDAIKSGVLKGEELQNAYRARFEAEKLLAITKMRLQYEESLNKTMGLSGAALKGMSGILGKLGLDKFMNLDETNKKMRDLAGEGKNSFQLMGFAAKETGKSLFKAVNDPVLIFGLWYKFSNFLITSALHYQTKMFDAAKSLGVNVGQAEKLMHHFNHAAAANTKMGLTADQISKTYAEMSNNLGVMVNQDEKFLADSAAISRNFGLSAQQMELVQLRSKETGKSVKDTFSSIVGTGKAMAQNLGISMTEKQIMEGISKTSATVFMNFKGNTQQLTEAVVKATKFGVTLDQINSAGSSMLNFESSISKEFEAQLLTGKNINLQKAREYALTGQTDKLMDEITKNLGNQNQWSKMNVLQQQSLAEAMGMSKEQVDEMYRKQTMISVLGKDANLSETERYQKLVEQKKSRAEIAKIMGEEATSRAVEASAQQQMTAAMENLKETFGSIAVLLKPITSAVSMFAEGVNTIAKGGTAIKVAFTGILLAMTAMTVRSSMLSIQAARQVALTKQKMNDARLAELMAKRELLTEQMKEASGKRQAVQSKINSRLSSVNAQIAAAEAAAKVTAGSGWMGPLAIGIGGIALTTLLGWLMSAGGEGGGGGGASSSASTSAPSMESSGRAISPTNPYAASARMQTLVPAGANGAPIINNNINVEMDQFTNKKMVSVNKTQGNGFDGQTGSNAQEKTVRRTGGS